MFKKIHLLITNEAQLNIGTIRNDNGGEYTSYVFGKYLQETSIKHHTKIPYNPQQNNVAEWMNKKLLNMIRSMMFFKNVNWCFGENQFFCATYIRNRCPSSIINNKTPYEMWYNRLPVVQNFRLFDSQCYSFIPKQQRNKLSARSRKCIFLGYSNTSKAYRLWDEEKKKFILSRDVVFPESGQDTSTVDRQFNHLEKFMSKKFFYEYDNNLPHPEGGIPILDYFVGFPLINLPLNDETEENMDDRSASIGTENVCVPKYFSPQNEQSPTQVEKPIWR